MSAEQSPRPSWLDGGEEAVAMAVADGLLPVSATLHRTEGATSDAVDAARWRRLVNASELPFPVAAIADDPENDRLMVYGRKRLEQFIDSLDLVSDKFPPAPNQGEAS
jgi:hypothetical protein